MPREYPSQRGPTIQELMWFRLDELMDSLLRDGDGYEEIQKGEAFGIAWCLAVMQNPYQPDVDSIRAKAMERYHARQITRPHAQ